MTAALYERDLAHEADMRALQRRQLEADCGGDMADDDEDDWGFEPLYKPTPEELAEHYADLDAQEAQYAFQQSQYQAKKATA